ncbi:PREDICTED: multidrug resistance-associated protein 7 [Dufourea novaeangliae]|uniref:ABC-type xenobiotic transporter n=1 Tax=Dufourea novaeangliae TaxID=178035 RepID=A0A154PDF4_DUFNO|nr:PREDICTED: multidrug resistance-associated protein 7 [Dufourea novaeangliae]KZC09882.1 Multidrug resistance-associated protein 7 [Dufourea novaeangliae]
MDNNWLNDGVKESWKWNWTELCGYHGGMEPLNPETHDLDVCFQQLCLQIPVLICIAIISAYHCGKRNSYSSHHHGPNSVIYLRILITMCLVLLPIVRAYIILVNTKVAPPNIVPFDNNSVSHESVIASYKNQDSLLTPLNIIDHIKEGLNRTIDYTKSILFPSSNIQNVTEYSVTPNTQDYNAVSDIVKDDVTSAKPIDYLVAGIEGLAWVVHLCFILSLRKGRDFNPRGPVTIRALILLLIVISILLLRSHIKYNPQHDVLPNLSLGFSISVVTLLILYAITLIPGHYSLQDMRSSRFNEIGERTALLSTPNSSYVRFPEEQDPTYLGTAMEDVTATSKFVFHWVNPLMEKGVRGLLNHSDDLFDLPEYISTNAISQKLDKHLQNMPGNINNRMENTELVVETDVGTVRNKMTLLHLLHKCFGWEFYSVGLLKFITDCTSFMGPILLNKLVGFIEDKNESISYGYLYASLIFISALIGAFCNVHFTFWMSVVGLKIRSTVITLLYRKTVHSSSVQLKQQFNFGEIVNFMSTDSDRLVNSCPSFHAFWSIPLQLVVTLYLLHEQIGISFLAGVTFAIVLIPINKVIATKIGELSTKLMEYKDQRVRLTGETLRGITTIKLNVWEDHFLRNIIKLRDNEIKYLSGRKYLDALCVYFWATTPVLISILTFATYVLLGNKLDAKTVFTSMALLNMLIGPLNAFPWVLNGLTEAWVSLKRIQRMLDLPDVDISSYYSECTPELDIMMQNVMLVVNTKHNTEENGLNASENITIPSSSSDSRKTVTFQDDGKFSLHDINITVPKGHLIGIMGEVGSGKSLLLDSILSEIIKVRGTIAVSDVEKGFAYVKQNPWLQRGTIRDNILFGKSYDYNKYKTILKACALTADLNSLPKKDLTIIGEAGSTLSGGQKTRISLARAVYADKDIYLLDDILATLDTKVASYIFQHVILDLLKNKTRLICTHQTQYLVHADLVVEMLKGAIINQGKPSDVLPDLEDYLLSSDSYESKLDITSINDLPREMYQADTFEKDPLLDKEITEKGTVQFGVYTCYLKAMGRYITISILVSMLLMQSSKNMTDLWMSYWVTHANTTSTNTTDRPSLLQLEYNFNDYSLTTDYYLTVYALLAVFNSLFTLMRAFVFAYGGIQAAIAIHKKLLKIVVRAKAAFFDIQPFGRIINRFSSDTYTIDDTLPFIANILFAQLFGLFATVIVTTYGLPWILLVLAPLIPVYHWIQNHYRLTSRELKRLSSTALSPLYAHFNETLHGLSTIRAFRNIPRFKQENELLLEVSQKTQFASIAVSQWLALRLQLIGVALLAGVSNIAVLQHQYNIADPGLIGLVITYALSVTGLLSGVINAFTETEREMIAVERVKQYLENVPVESVKGDNPPYAWPSQGVVEFKEVVLQYREHLLPSLNGVTFFTRPAEKIGVVGRTGAGKSSLFASLFRLTEITSGIILIDNVNIQSLQLNALRSRLAIIPQNPFLFSGTIRENLDPLNQYPDLHIYKALEKCKIHSLVYRLGGFGAALDECGSNLSAGQRQLFCLARAVLHNAKIVCIDEATANVDQETDKFIQTTIKSSFQSATVITVVLYRFRFRVLVMGEGEVLEFDEPNLLVQNIDSHFYQLASQEFSGRE